MLTKKMKKEFISKTKYECSMCGISEWQCKPISLEIDHIDGNRYNNSHSNLRYLCPNCHSQTDTFRGRNIKKMNTVSDTELLTAIEAHGSVRAGLIAVGLAPKGGNYNRVWNLVGEQTEVDTKNSQYGTVWINNGNQNKKIKKELLEEYQNAGWVQGRILANRIHSQRGRIWVTNGLDNRMIDPNTPIPDGYWKGRFIPKISHQ